MLQSVFHVLQRTGLNVKLLALWDLKSILKLSYIRPPVQTRLLRSFFTEASCKYVHSFPIYLIKKTGAVAIKSSSVRRRSDVEMSGRYTFGDELAAATPWLSVHCRFAASWERGAANEQLAKKRKRHTKHTRQMPHTPDALFTYRPSPGCWRRCCHPPHRPWSPAWSGPGPQTCWSPGRGCCPQTVVPDSSARWSSSCGWRNGGEGRFQIKRKKRKTTSHNWLLHNAGVVHSAQHKWLSIPATPGINRGEWDTAQLLNLSGQGGGGGHS